MSNSFHQGFEQRNTLKHPFDEGLKQLAGNFAGVVKPIIETVDRRGLKKRFLGKFRNSIDQFYKGLVDDDVSEAAGKLVERLQKNRNKMFTFLDFDDVPWNNNNAEHAVKAFALLRRVIDGTYHRERPSRHPCFAERLRDV